MTTPQKQHGYMLLVALFLIIIVAGASAVLLNRLSRNQVQTTQDTLLQAQMQEDVSSAINIAVAKLTTPVVQDVSGNNQRTTCNNLQNLSFSTTDGLGNVVNYSYTTTYYAPTQRYSMFIGQTMSPTSTTLPFYFNNSLAATNFAPYGVAMIGSEIFTYTGNSATNSSIVCSAGASCLTGLTRGVLDSNSSYHYAYNSATNPLSSLVVQRQCNVTATITVSANGNTLSLPVSFIVGLFESGIIAGSTLDNNSYSTPAWNLLLTPGTWQTPTTSNLQTYSPFMAATLLSSNTGWIVGRYDPVNSQQNIFFWNGVFNANYWSNASIPCYNCTQQPNLQAITCLNDNLCFLGGTTNPPQSTPFIERYVNNGTPILYSMPFVSFAPTSTTISGLACPSLSLCWAITSPTTTGTTGPSFILQSTSSDNGATWSSWSTVNNPANSSNIRFTGITCISSNATSTLNNGYCYIVGTQSNSSNSPTILQWSGSGSWQTVNVQNTSGDTTGANFGAISCTPTAGANRIECWAVSSNNLAFAKMSGNGVWQMTPALLSSYNFDTVACTNADNNCWASDGININLPSNSNGHLIHWDGQYWSYLTDSSGNTVTYGKPFYGLAMSGKRPKPLWISYPF